MAKVSLETVDTVRRRLAVEVPAIEVTTEIERAYDQLRRTASVRGFRPGRAPRAVLEQLFGDRVRADVFGKLVHDSFHEALRDQKLDPVGQPEIITERAEPGEALRYSATVEVRPDVVATGYAGLRVERPLRTVVDQDVDAFLENLRQSAAQLHPISDRTVAQPGDVAIVDYEARSNARLLGRAEARLVAVSTDSTEGIGGHLDGAEVGRAVEYGVDYPEDHSNPDLAGKHVEFHVLVKSLAHKEVPALDDEFAKTHGGSDTVAELRERVRRQLETTALREADGAARAALVDQLVGSHTVEVPRAMVERRVEALAEYLFDSLGPRRPPASREAEVRAQLRGELEPRATAQVKASLILDAIAAQEGLEVADADLDAQIEQLAQHAGNAAARMRALYQDANARASLRARMLQERALDLVLDRAEVRTVAPTSSVADG